MHDKHIGHGDSKHCTMGRASLATLLDSGDTTGHLQQSAVLQFLQEEAAIAIMIAVSLTNIFVVMKYDAPVWQPL